MSVTVAVLQSVCAGCGKRGHNYLVDRECFTLVCLECLGTFVCPCFAEEVTDEG